MAKTYLLYSAYFDLTNPGGGAVFSMDITREWLRRGHRVHVASAKRSTRLIGDLQSYLDAGQLKIHGITSLESLVRPHELSRATARAGAALVREIKPDEIHVHNFQGMLSAVSETTGKGAPTTYVALDFGMSCLNFYRYDGSLVPCDGPSEKKCKACILRFEEMGIAVFPKQIFGVMRKFLSGRGGGHRKYFDFRLHRYLRQAPKSLNLMLDLLSRFDRIIAPSPPVQASILNFRKSKAGVLSLSYPVSPHKLPRPEVKSMEVQNSPLRLIFLGNAHPIKGWPFFLSVLEALPDGLRLEIIDANANTNAFKQASHRTHRYLKTSKRWPTDSVRDLMAETDAVLVPSLWHENTPLVVLESLANHRPVIASDQKGISHMIQTGKNGILIPPGNRDEWVRSLEELSRDPQILRKMRPSCNYNRGVADFVNELEANHD